MSLIENKESLVEEAQIFLDKHNINLKDVMFCECEGRYFHKFEGMVEGIEQPDNHKEWYAEEIRWIPEYFGELLGLSDKKFQKVDTTQEEWASYESIELE